MYVAQKQGRTMAVLDFSVKPLSKITIKSAKYHDEKRTVCLIIIPVIYIIDPKGLGSGNKIDSLRNSRTFFNLPNVFRPYIRLLIATRSEITVEFKERAMLESSDVSDLLSVAMLLKQ